MGTVNVGSELSLAIAATSFCGRGPGATVGRHGPRGRTSLAAARVARRAGRRAGAHLQVQRVRDHAVERRLLAPRGGEDLADDLDGQAKAWVLRVIAQGDDDAVPSTTDDEAVHHSLQRRLVQPLVLSHRVHPKLLTEAGRDAALGPERTLRPAPPRLLAAIRRVARVAAWRRRMPRGRRHRGQRAEENQSLFFSDGEVVKPHQRASPNSALDRR